MRCKDIFTKQIQRQRSRTGQRVVGLLGRSVEGRAVQIRVAATLKWLKTELFLRQGRNVYQSFLLLDGYLIVLID